MANASLYFANALGAIIWFIWLPAAAGVIVRAIRRAWTRQNTPRVGAFVVWAFVVLLVGLAVFLSLSYAVDSVMLTSSGVWVFGGERSTEFWGLPSRGLYVLLDGFLSMSPEGTAWMLCSFYLLTPWVFLAVLVGLPTHASGRAQPVAVGGWKASLARHWPALVLGLIVFNPVMSVGHLNAWYLTPLPVAFGVALVAARDEENGGGWLSLLALCSSLLMVSLFRPESAPVTVVIALAVLYRIGRQRVNARVALLATLSVLCFLCVSAVWNLLSSLQGDRFVFAEDTGQVTSIFDAIPMLFGRLAAGLPGALSAQILVTGGLLGFAVIAIVRAVRKRSADLPTLMSAIWLVLELLILSVHEEGPGCQTLKYGLVLMAPACFLAAAELSRHRDGRAFALRFGLALFLSTVAIVPSLLGNHIFLDYYAIGAFERDAAFEVVDVVCPKLEAEKGEVLTLDIHGAYRPTVYGDWSRQDAEVVHDPAASDAPSTWLISEMLSEAGCYAKTTCDHGSDSSGMTGVRDLSLEFGSLCGRSCEDGGPEPRWNDEFGVAVVTAVDSRWLTELETLLAGPENCGWHAVSRLPNTMILLR